MKTDTFMQGKGREIEKEKNEFVGRGTEDW